MSGFIDTAGYPQILHIVREVLGGALEEIVVVVSYAFANDDGVRKECNWTVHPDGWALLVLATSVVLMTVTMAARHRAVKDAEDTRLRKLARSVFGRHATRSDSRGRLYLRYYRKDALVSEQRVDYLLYDRPAQERQMWQPVLDLLAAKETSGLMLGLAFALFCIGLSGVRFEQRCTTSWFTDAYNCARIVFAKLVTGPVSQQKFWQALYSLLKKAAIGATPIYIMLVRRMTIRRPGPGLVEQLEFEETFDHFTMEELVQELTKATEQRDTRRATLLQAVLKEKRERVEDMVVLVPQVPREMDGVDVSASAPPLITEA